MRLKTAKTNAKDACQEAFIRRGFETATYNPRCVGLRLENKPGEVYKVWFPHDGDRRDWFVRIYKGTAGSKTIRGVDWDWTNTIKLKLV